MKYQSIFLILITYLLVMLAAAVTSSFFSLLQLNAQVPAEEFGITKTCSETEIQPSLNDKSKSLITDKGAEQEFFIYSNTSLGYTIEYPNDWKGTETNCILEASGIIQTSSIINFMSTPNSSNNGLLGIAVDDFPTDLSIEELVTVFSEDFGNVIESKEIIMLDEKPSAKFTINAGNDNKLTQITILSNDKKYDITYPIKNWISNSTIQYMIHSFKILDKGVLNSKEISESNELG